MSQPIMRGVLSVGCVVSVAVVAAATMNSGCAVTSKRRGSSTVVRASVDAGLRAPPLSDWQLRVDERGSALLKTSRGIREFRLTGKQQEALMACLQVERFGELRDKYGWRVLDGPQRTISVSWGTQSNTVTIYSLGVDYVLGTPLATLKEASRAVRVFDVIRSLFQDEAAFDSSRSDRNFVEWVTIGERRGADFTWLIDDVLNNGDFPQEMRDKLKKVLGDIHANRTGDQSLQTTNDRRPNISTTEKDLTH